MISKVLSAHGFTIDAVSDGLAGLLKVEESLPDIIICDLMMPELDGLSFAKAIRASSSNIPIIFVTAKSDVADVVEGMQAGANGYLAKPFKRDELLAAITRALSARRAPR